MNNNKKYNITFYINFILKKQYNLDIYLNNEEFNKNINNFIINRFISCSNYNIQIFNIINLINRYCFAKPFYQHKYILFSLLYLLIPQENKYKKINYIKSSSKEKNIFDKNIYVYFKKIYNCHYLSNIEIEENIKILLKKDPNKLISNFISAGLTFKEIKTNFKNLISYDIINKYKNLKISKKEIKEIKKQLIGDNNNGNKDKYIKNSKLL